MNDSTFTLFVEVMNAAREGRYMFGNGAEWYVTNEYGQKLVINTVRGTKQFCPSYVGTPRVDMDVADRMRAFLLNAEKESSIPMNHRYWDAHDMVAYAVRHNNVMYTNGNDWWIRTGGSYVACVQLGIRGTHTMVTFLSAHSSWCYLQSNRPVLLTEATKQYMGFC